MRVSGALAFAFVSATLALGGCASFLPASGPESWDVRNPLQDPRSLPYALVPVTSQVVDVLARNAPRISNVFADHSPPTDIRFGIGDLVSVTIFEAAAGGLFIPAQAGVRPGNYITLPNQLVDSNGNISVPYAGNIPARGHTQVQVQQEIVEALKKRAIEPQVVVSLIEQRSTLISVLGDVNSPNRFPVNHAGERMLDAIAQAGGPKKQGFEEWVVLERGGKRAVAPFGALIWEPQNNIYLRPDDTIFLYTEAQTFIAFGATATQGGGQTAGQGLVNFESWRMSLAEALGKTGGLSDATADPTAVFLYRGEPREVAIELGVDVSHFEGPVIPIIYNLNLHEPVGYFFARKFEMRNKDVLYLANAPAVEATKAMNFFRTVVGTVNDPMVAAINFYALKGAASPASASTITLVGGTAVTPH
jgi:polysaccharide export outer membrane protein